MIVGAGGGIAAETARIVADRGGRVMAVDRDRDAVDRTVKALAEGHEHASFTCDALSEQDVAETVSAILEACDRVDGLLNAVGGSTVIKNPHATLEELSISDWNKLITFNLLPGFLFCRSFVPAMKEQRYGRIVNVSSHAANGVSSASCAYAAAKAGVMGFTRKLAIELGPFGVTCNAVLPARTLTERVMGTQFHTGMKDYAEFIPLRRLSTAVEQAEVIAFLLSDASSYVTGAAMEVDGGGLMP